MRYLLFLLSAYALTAHADVRVQGQILNISSGRFVLEQYFTSAPTEVFSGRLDSAGRFSFYMPVPEAGFYRFSVESEDHSELAGEYINLVLDTAGEIVIRASAPSIGQNFSISGSPDSELLRQINKVLARSFHKLDSLTRSYNEARVANHSGSIDQLSRTFQLPYQKVLQEREDFIRDIILDHPSSIAILTIINYLDPERDFEAFRLVDIAMVRKYPAHPFVMEFHQKTIEYSRLAAGSPAPELILNDHKGREIRLSALQGKTVLVHFWASWHGPCRQDNPDLIRLYKKYRDAGLEVVSVSLDRDKEAWVDVIKEDRMSWINVSDLMEWSSPVVKLYNLRSLPYSYLVDPNGNIIYKGSGSKTVDERLGLIFSVNKE